tara:strand:+ start:200 stop:1168 length:969 start_codon:yes stop_codon:yes gene_type:complete
MKNLEKKLYESMFRIRMVEEEIVNRYHEQKMRCPTHLSIGQEAVPAALGLSLDKTDLAVSTHRGHAHYIGKGGNLKSMIAEIYGKATGCSKGKGGSMHLIDTSVGFMGTSAIVGNSIPVGVGMALSSKINNSSQITCVFLGDGATEEGVYYESVNFAVLKNLPVLFLCENNLYSVYSPLEVRQPENRKIWKVAQSLGLNSSHVDGNNALECYDAIELAKNNIRNGKGPQFIEFSTYRWREHCGVNFDNDIGYRSEKEYNEWKTKDPIKLLQNKIILQKNIQSDFFQSIENEIKNEINEAFEFAERSPFPESKEAFQGEYAES